MLKSYVVAAVLGLSLVACEKKDAQPESAPADAPAEAPADAPKVEETPPEAGESPEPGAASQQGKLELPEDLGAGETKLYGSRFTIIEEPMTLAAAVEKAAEHPGPYKIDATMEQVCAKKGCWFTLAGEGIDKPIRVRMKDYGFFVPRNAAGSRVIVEGELTAREMPADEAKHYAEDEGKSPEEVAKIGATKVYEFTATAVEVTMPKG